MNHAFDVDIATEYGIEEAIMIQFLQFWIAKNKANEKHFHEGRTWTYNSASALLELFPYFKSEKKAQRLMRHLEEEGVIMSGNFNENPFDKTKWYAFCDESRFLKTDKKAQSDRSKKSAMKDKTDHSLLTVVDTVVDTFKNNTRQARNGLYETEFEEVWNAYPKRPGSSKAAAFKAFVARRNAGHSLETILSGVRAYSAYCIAKVSDSSYIKHLSTFLGAGEYFLSDWSTKASAADTNAGVKGSLGSILLAVQNERKAEEKNGN